MELKFSSLVSKQDRKLYFYYSYVVRKTLLSSTGMTVYKKLQAKFGCYLV